MAYEPEMDPSQRRIKLIVIAVLLIAVVHITIGFFLVNQA